MAAKSAPKNKGVEKAAAKRKRRGTTGVHGGRQSPAGPGTKAKPRIGNAARHKGESARRPEAVYDKLPLAVLAEDIRSGLAALIEAGDALLGPRTPPGLFRKWVEAVMRGREAAARVRDLVRN